VLQSKVSFFPTSKTKATMVTAELTTTRTVGIHNPFNKFTVLLVSQTQLYMWTKMASRAGQMQIQPTKPFHSA